MCPVCFSSVVPEMRDTLNAGIGVLMGVTVVVLALFARFFVRLARRSRAAAHLVNHTIGAYESREDLQPGRSRSSASARASTDNSGQAEAHERRIA